MKAARRLEPFDLELSRETYLAAWSSAGMAAHLTGPGGLVEISRAVQALPPPTGDPSPLDLLVDGLAVLTLEGHAAATPTLRRAANAIADMPVEGFLRWGWMVTAASAVVWDFENMHATTARHVQLARDSGALAHLPASLENLGITRAWMGDFAGTVSVIAESESAAAATGSPMARYTSIRLLALQGREAEASHEIASAIELATASGQGMAAAWARWAAAVLYNGLARYEEAAVEARQATSDTLNPWMEMWAMPEVVEAAARSGDVDLAGEALDRLAKTTTPSGTDWALGIEARCRALVSAGADAERLYEEAIERLGRTRLRPELARARLLYGEWLRRSSRRVEARTQLRAAHELFEVIGMDAFAERAARELQATGETVRRRTPETRDDLTAQERQIAELARDGLSNPEIGARLFLSPRTVEWHLRKVFAKLGLRSRRELAKALTACEAELVSA
jgi:DNA-binding CsgD family transcriptional regulator